MSNRRKQSFDLAIADPNAMRGVPARLQKKYLEVAVRNWGTQPENVASVVITQAGKPDSVRIRCTTSAAQKLKDNKGPKHMRVRATPERKA